MSTQEFLTLLPRGKANAIPRRQLSIRLGVSDRVMRQYIQAARDGGVLILNDQDGHGYYLADETDLDAIERQYRQDTARALSILGRRKAMRRILKAAGRRV